MRQVRGTGWPPIAPEGALVDYIDKARHQVIDLVGKVVGATGGGVSTQTVTIAAPRAQVQRFWRDPENLSAVLDGIVRVSATGPDRLEWRFDPLDGESLRWETEVVDKTDELRFVGEHDDQIRVSFADAPHDLGTEVTIRTTTPAPGSAHRGRGLHRPLPRPRPAANRRITHSRAQSQRPTR